MQQLKAMWEPGFERIMLNKDPQKIADEIFSISDEPTKEQIVDKARDESTELHDLFEWNDTIAAEEWRKEQAGAILRKLKVVFINDDADEEHEETKTIPVRMFYGNPKTNEGFVHIEKIMSNDDMYEQLLEKAKGELIAFRKKYSMLKELNPLFEAIDRIDEIK